MNALKKTKVMVAVALLICTAVAAAFWYSLQRFENHHSQLSEKPAREYSKISLQAIESTLGLGAKIPYASIQKAAEAATEKPQQGTGERQTCKKILGAKACATLLWNYTIERSGPITLVQAGEKVRLTLPLALDGTVSVDGRGGKLFGLRNKQISGNIEILADLQVSIDKSWCPNIDSNLSYRWVSDPQIRLVGKIKINLRKSADRALNKKLKSLEQELTQMVDCDKFRESIADNWRVHEIPIKIPPEQQAFLQVTPQSAAVTKTKATTNHVYIALEMLATTEVIPHSGAELVEQPDLPLPQLSSQIPDPGSVEFSLLMNLSYQQIQQLVSARLLGKLSQQGDKNFTITSFDLYPSNDRLIFDLGFTATGIGKFLTTSGQLYLSAIPVADADANELRFEDLKFTRILDSDMWSVLSTVLHQKILNSMKDAAVIDLSRQMTKLEKSITDTLSDPSKTANIEIVAATPDVRLVAVNPEADSLAAIIHVSTRLEATIPPEVLLRN